MPPPGHAVLPPATHYRWLICALLLAATTVNYVDRQVLSVLAPRLTAKYGWSESHYGFIVSAFTLAYAIGYAGAGRLIDRIGERRGLALAVGLWSLAAMAHGLVGPLAAWSDAWAGDERLSWAADWLTPALVSVAGFAAARFALGLTVGGHFPGAIKAVGVWHPKRERALATGLFNSGSNLGIILAAWLVPLAIEEAGWPWEATFYAAGGLGLIWLVAWRWFYGDPRRCRGVSSAELALITSDTDGTEPTAPQATISWLALVRYRQTWAYALGMFLTSPVWWFIAFWLPKFLENNHKIDIGTVSGPTLLVYSLASLGSIGGGALSSWLLRRGASLNAARKTAFLACALCALPVVCVARIDDLWLAMSLVGLAAAAHAGFAANLFTIVSDTVPRQAVSSVVGIGGTAACVGMVLLSTVVGWVLDWTKLVYGEKDYLIPFVICGSAYLVATALIHLLLPRMEPLRT